MLLHEKQYIDFIQQNGVGENDRVASSIVSYLSYLRSVSALIQEDITPALLKTEVDVINIAEKMKGIEWELWISIQGSRWKIQSVVEAI